MDVRNQHQCVAIAHKHGLRPLILTHAADMHAQIAILRSAGLRDQQLSLQHPGWIFLSQPLILGEIELPLCQLPYDIVLVELCSTILNKLETLVCH